MRSIAPFHGGQVMGLVILSGLEPTEVSEQIQFYRPWSGNRSIAQKETHIAHLNKAFRVLITIPPHREFEIY
jgi:hypothetical protein